MAQYRRGILCGWDHDFMQIWALGIASSEFSPVNIHARPGGQQPCSASQAYLVGCEGPGQIYKYRAQWTSCRIEAIPDTTGQAFTAGTRRQVLTSDRDQRGGRWHKDQCVWGDHDLCRLPSSVWEITLDESSFQHYCFDLLVAGMVSVIQGRVDQLLGIPFCWEVALGELQWAIYGDRGLVNHKNIT